MNNRRRSDGRVYRAVSLLAAFSLLAGLVAPASSMADDGPGEEILVGPVIMYRNAAAPPHPMGDGGPTHQVGAVYGQDLGGSVARLTYRHTRPVEPLAPSCSNPDRAFPYVIGVGVVRVEPPRSAANVDEVWDGFVAFINSDWSVGVYPDAPESNHGIFRGYDGPGRSFVIDGTRTTDDQFQPGDWFSVDMQMAEGKTLADFLAETYHVPLDRWVSWPDYLDETMFSLNGFAMEGRSDANRAGWYDECDDWGYRKVTWATGGLLRVIEDKVTLSIELSKETAQIGESVAATVHVASLDTEPVTVSFPGGLLSADEGAGIEFEAGEVEPFVLTPEDPTRSFPTIVTATAGGSHEVRSRVLAQTADGELDLSASETVQVPFIDIALRALPLVDGKPIVSMSIEGEGEDRILRDGDGNVVDLKVEVAIRNASGRPATAMLQGADPRARDRSELLGRISTIAPFPIDLGTIEAGATVTREIDVNVMLDGRFEFAALVTATPEGGAQSNFSGRGAPIAVGEAYPVGIEFQLVEHSSIQRSGKGGLLVQPGARVGVIASVANRTSNSTLEFYGMKAIKEGNAFGGVLTSDQGNALEPPFAHDFEVEAGATEVLYGLVLTDPAGAPTGTIEWIGIEGAILTDTETGEETAVDPDDILVTTDFGGWKGNDLAARIIQNYLLPPAPPPLSRFQTVKHYGTGIMFGMVNWTTDMFELIGMVGTGLGYASNYVTDPAMLARAMGEASRAVWAQAELAATTWAEMSTEEREEFILAVANETTQRAVLLANAPFDPDNRAAAVSFAREAVYSLFTSIEDAYATDDPAQIAEVWGRVSGNIGMEVASAFIPSPKFAKYTTGAEFNRMAKAADNVRLPNTQQNTLRTIPSGAISREVAEEAWGVGGRQLDRIQEFFDMLGIKGYARERTPRSLHLSEVLDEAVLKPEAMKPKGISDLDLKILGDSPPMLPSSHAGRPGVELEGVTAIFMPQSDQVIRARLAGESDEVIKAALDRAASRREEFAKYSKQFDKWKRDGLPVEFNYKDNDALPFRPQEPPGATRPFDFETVIASDGTVMLVPKMANESGSLRYITGDIDWVHFSFLDGTALDPRTAGIVYDVLSRCCGLQHGDTSTWINKGQSVFRGKANQIAEYVSGQKALLEVTGDSIRAARIKPNMTRFANDGRNHIIYFDGGSQTLDKALRGADLESALNLAQRLLPPRKLVLPFFWLNRGAQAIEGDTTIDGREWAYSDDPDAVLAREGADNLIEWFNGIDWLPWDLDQRPNPFQAGPASWGAAEGGARTFEGVKLALTPTSFLTADAFAGGAEIEILDIANLWAQELANRLEAWFQAGDPIVIAPGHALQETRRIVSMDPILLDHPLGHTHAEGTLVAVLSQSLIDAIDTVERAELIDTRALADIGVALTFRLPFLAALRAETSQDLETWEKLQPSEVDGGILIDDIIKLEYPGETVIILLEFYPDGQHRRFLRWRQE